MASRIIYGADCQPVAATQQVAPTLKQVDATHKAAITTVWKEEESKTLCLVFLRLPIAERGKE